MTEHPQCAIWYGTLLHTGSVLVFLIHCHLTLCLCVTTSLEKSCRFLRHIGVWTLGITAKFAKNHYTQSPFEVRGRHHITYQSIIYWHSDPNATDFLLLLIVSNRYRHTPRKPTSCFPGHNSLGINYDWEYIFLLRFNDFVNAGKGQLLLWWIMLWLI